VLQEIGQDLIDVNRMGITDLDQKHALMTQGRDAKNISEILINCKDNSTLACCDSEQPFIGIPKPMLFLYIEDIMAETAKQGERGTRDIFIGQNPHDAMLTCLF
jgi:hypothetical protein